MSDSTQPEMAFSSFKDYEAKTVTNFWSNHADPDVARGIVYRVEKILEDVHKRSHRSMFDESIEPCFNYDEFTCRLDSKTNELRFFIDVHGTETEFFLEKLPMTSMFDLALADEIGRKRVQKYADLCLFDLEVRADLEQL